MYSDTLIDHFCNPRNVGELDPPAITIEVSNPVCGDIFRLSALVEDGIIRQVRFKTRGCSASIAAGSAVTEWLTGVPLTQVAGLKTERVEELVGGLSQESKHAARLCVDGVRALLTACRDRG